MTKATAPIPVGMFINIDKEREDQITSVTSDISAPYGVEVAILYNGKLAEYELWEFLELLGFEVDILA